MKLWKQWSLAGLFFCLFLLVACSIAQQNDQEQLQPKTPEECQIQMEEKLSEYAAQWDVFTQNLEQFYTTVEQGGHLKQLDAYHTFQTDMEKWCDTIDTYTVPQEWENCQSAYIQLTTLAQATRSFLTETKTVQTTEEMDAAVDSYVQSVAPILAERNTEELEEAEPDWLVGTWNTAGENGGQDIYIYRADGTATFPDGTQYVWRRKGAEELEDSSVWKAEFPKADSDVQVYYLSADGTEVIKEAVARNEDGSLQVTMAWIYGEETESIVFLPYSE